MHTFRFRWRLGGAFALLLAATVLGNGFATSAEEPMPRYQELVQRYEVVKTEAKKKAVEEGRALRDRPGQEYVALFERLAGETKDGESAKCWLKVLELGAYFDQKEKVELATKTLLADHMLRAELVEIVGLVGRIRTALGKEQGDLVLRDVMAKSPHKGVRAAAMLALAQALYTRKTADAQAEGKALLETLAKDFGDLPTPKRAGQKDRTYGQLATAELTAREKLNLGSVAPDFEAVDENGTKFKLSDYRGKVVVIDFWGEW